MEAPRKSRATTWVLSVVVLLLLYVLSIGPVAYSTAKGWLGESARTLAYVSDWSVPDPFAATYVECLPEGLAQFYMPLRQLNRVMPKKNLLTKYTRWWLEKGFGP